MDENDIYSFLSELSGSLAGLELNGDDNFNYKEIQLQAAGKTCVIDYSENRLIYSKGFENTWGYADDDMSLELLLENVHPDDKNLVHRLGRATLLYSMEYPKHSYSNVLNITYRCKKKNGDYGRYLCQVIVLKANSKGVV
ncbi:MAG: hypothetical protein U5K51_02290 [Flavobacteriaceae bacterium]|nr:hypothetical protein [Flavobacteriaceae bacterium]